LKESLWSRRALTFIQVWEELGYDISPHFVPGRKPHTALNSVPPPLGDAAQPNDDYLDLTVQDQNIRLYIVPGVAEDAAFVTQTRKEISKIAWFNLKELPGWSKKGGSEAVTAAACFDSKGNVIEVVTSTSRFYGVMPIVRYV
jgi:8-oxo-dGTP pyrophosphatase MutT (NUDIX family)